ncbi:MAG: hypothetical protein ACK5LC_09645 [Coprobacillaceae bacterium]
MEMKQDKTRNIFILLTRTSTPFSRAIRLVTQCEYTHASIGIAENSNEFFSFGRKEAYTLPTTAGFINENLLEGILYRNQDSPCMLFRLKVTEEVYLAIQDKLKDFERQYEKYSYSFLGTVLCYFSVPHTIKNKYFCSQFVAEILSSTNALDLGKSPSIYHPSDFVKEPKLECCYQGTLKELAEFLKNNNEVSTYYSITQQDNDFISHGKA